MKKELFIGLVRVSSRGFVETMVTTQRGQSLVKLLCEGWQEIVTSPYPEIVEMRLQDKLVELDKV